MLSRNLKRWVKQNPFTILGLHPSCSSKEVKLAYYKLAKKYHPDINSHYQEYFRQISLAYKEIQEMGDNRPNFDSEKPEDAGTKDSERKPKRVPRPKPVRDDNVRAAKRFALMETFAIIGVIGLILIRILMISSAKEKEILINLHNKSLLEKEMGDDSVKLDKFYQKFEENFGDNKSKN
ncbi:hypothetical protein SteCoe_24207 [Stentor coeruleus]|uniref:J domain-containing protein n=1 Tax=Stentor coeruleus TaxID=5963 RepID=A0A1R2BI12_9CILI|nr:hypothetical protein SteCoe_24207 [Stentor coeruleus]